jgi:hypothetical protein
MLDQFDDFDNPTPEPAPTWASWRKRAAGAWERLAYHMTEDEAWDAISFLHFRIAEPDTALTITPADKTPATCKPPVTLSYGDAAEGGTE